MLPQFARGDYIGGIATKNFSQISDFFDQPCIVETDDNRRRLRKIGYSKGQTFLYGINTRHKSTPLFEVNPTITMIAPVFWHRFQYNFPE